jgi:hypothetical protein
MVSKAHGFTPVREVRHRSSSPPAHSAPGRGFWLYFGITLIALNLAGLFFVTHRSPNRPFHIDDEFAPWMQSIFLPYIYEFSSTSIVLVNTTVAGVSIQMPVDTGSTGTLIGAPLLPDVSPGIGMPAYEFFSSSTILYTGRLVNLPFVFYGENGTNATTRVEVLVVDKSLVCPWYDPVVDRFECPKNPDFPDPVPRNTSNITYMGVGFGRADLAKGQPYGLPSMNPFLNIEYINGEIVLPFLIRLGYTVSTDGVHIGLTGENTQGFQWTKLSPGLRHNEDARDWSMPSMCFSADGEFPNCGYALIDTGIAHMYVRTAQGISLPNVTRCDRAGTGGEKCVHRVKPRTKLDIGFPRLDKYMPARYDFEVGEGSKVEPSFVVPERQGSPPFVNTGRNFLFGWSVAFDAIGGEFGYRPVSPASPQKHP